MIQFLHGLPPDTWKEPDPTDPLSIVDQVIRVFLEEIFMDIFHIHKVELSLAYGCADSVDHRTMLQYIHYNRHHNSLQINATGVCF